MVSPTDENGYPIIKVVQDVVTVPAHAATHEDGGSDEIQVENLPTTEVDTSTRLAPDGAGGVQFVVGGGAPSAHATTHENGGSDEINVAGLSGLLADAPTPTTHAASHQNGGADEINVAGLNGLLADAQTPTAHASTHDQGGTDEITAQDLGSGAALATQIMQTYGAGGWTLIPTPGGAVYGTERHFAKSDPEQTTTSGTPVTALTTTTPALPAGTYEVDFQCEISHTSRADSTVVEFRINGTVVGLVSIEPKDSTNYYSATCFDEVVVGAGTMTLDIRFYQVNGTTSQIRRCRIRSKRVA